MTALALLWLAACDAPLAGSADGRGDSGEADSGDADSGDADSGAGLPCDAAARLELVPLDIWGRDLDATPSLDRDARLLDDPAAAPGVLLVPLGDDAVALQVALAAPDHVDAGVRVLWDGQAVTTEAPTGGARVATSTDTRTLDGHTCTVTTVYLGLDHAWFAATGPAPTRNDATLLIDGEAFWDAVADDLDGAERRVSWATWWWDSDFEIVRPDGHAGMSEAEREPNTILRRLEERAGVPRRLLINRFWDENTDWNEYLNTDAALRAYADAGGDDVEVVLQGNPAEVPVTGQWEGEVPDFDFAARVAENPRYAGRAFPAGERHAADLELQAASWHQKLMVMDGEVAYVTGFNTGHGYWDTTAHLVFDARRMDFDADEDERAAVEAKAALPDHGPVRDYGVRLAGPAARDVEAVFADRWDLALAEGDLYAEHATAFALDDAPVEPADGVPVQVVATMPEPLATQALRETHAKAFGNAERYVLVEDQYFRAPLMNELLVARMLEEPELRLIVVTQPVSATDGAAKWTWVSDETFRSLFPDRYLVVQLRAVDVAVEEGWWWDTVEVAAEDFLLHSKLRIVDDRYLSVGSCNMNNRGYLYEGELDVAILDEAFATEARRTVLAQLVGDDWDDLLSDDAENNLDVLAAAAEQNAAVLDWWEDNAGDLDADEATDEWAARRPSGFVYPLSFDPDYTWDVGPDLF